MVIVEVRPGDSLAAIAERENVPESRLMADNGLPSPAITPGQALLVPTNRYVVRPGDSLFHIAELSGVPLPALRRANPGIGGTLYPGRVVRIPPVPKTRAEVIGYLPLTDPNVTAADIPFWGPNLTWVAIFTHIITPEGNLPPINDTEAIRATYAAGAKPLMSIANIRQGGAFSTEVATAIITDKEVRRRVLDNTVRLMNEKGYAGVDADIENVPRGLREGYVDFLRELKERIGGKHLNVAVAPKYDETTFAYARGHDYAGIGRVADRVYIMNYEFHWVGGPPGPVAPQPMTRRVILYAASLIPREKLLSGISTTAYDWERPDTPQNMARPWPDDQAVQIAIRHGSTIRYDEPDETPWFRYTEGNTLREVWFEDARSIMAKFRTIRGAGIGGTGVWHLGARNTQLNTLLSNFFTVQR